MCATASARGLLTPPEVAGLLRTLRRYLGWRRAGATGLSDAERRHRELTWLHEVSVAVGDSPTFEAALREVLQRMCAFTGWAYGEAWLPSPDGSALERSPVMYGEGPRLAAFGREGARCMFPWGIGLPGRAWASGRLVVEPDVQRSVNFPRAPAAVAAGLRLGIALPVRAHDETVVVLSFLSFEAGAPAPELVEMASMVALKLGNFIHRKRVEEALRSQERQLRAIFESALDAKLLMDERGQVVDANPAAVQLLGRGLDLLRGLSLSELASAADIESSARAWDRMLIDQLFEIQLRLDRPDGTARIADCRLKAHVTPERHLVVMRDMTEEHRLQHQVDVSSRMASLGTLAGGVAHEINNPLAYVIANLGFVEDELRELRERLPEDRTEELVDAVAQAREGADRVKRIVADLKAFSRAEEDALKPLDVLGAVDFAVRMTANQIVQRAQLVKSYQAGLWVRANEGRLGQVLLNLLTNAIQAMPEGSPHEHTLAVRVVTGIHSQAVIEIEDTGCGIPLEIQHRVFEPFFTTKPVGVGTGLGLSVCHSIARSFGGEISFESRPGSGTTFRLVLPLCDPPAEAAGASLRGLSAGVRPRILVVDDEPEIGAAIARALRGECDTRSVTGGQEALRLLEAEEPFDLILCDLMMPEMSGMELHEELRTRWPALLERTVYMTGGAFTPLARQFLDSVPNRRLGKPFEIDSLRALIREAIDAARGGAQDGSRKAG